MGFDLHPSHSLYVAQIFQSTHPSWGATQGTNSHGATMSISIHAPIVGCDVDTRCWKSQVIDFNPRTHRGVRPMALQTDTDLCNISIHAPIVGCDEDDYNKHNQRQIFQSTHPSWGATEKTELTSGLD